MLAFILLFLSTCHGFATHNLSGLIYAEMRFKRNIRERLIKITINDEGSHMDRNNFISDKAVTIDRTCLSIGIISLILILNMLILASPLRAESANEFEEEVFILPTETVTIGDLVQYAYQNNPSITEAREDWKASIEEYRVAEGYPDPQLKFSYFIEPIETRLGPQDWNATLSQKIPFPGRLTRAGEVAMADAEISRLQFDKAIRDVIVAIRESYFELYYIRNAKTIVDKNVELLDHMRKISETEYGQDKAILLDVVKAQSQVGQLKYDALLLDELENTEITNLNGLLNRLPDDPIGIFVVKEYTPILFPLNEIYKMAEVYQQEIQMAVVNIKKAEANASLARYKNYPDFNLGVFYAGIGDPDVANPPSDSGRDALGIQAGISIPLWVGKNKSRVNKALAQKRKAKATKTRRVNETQTKIRANYFRLNNANRLIKLYRDELIPQAARSIELAETWFQEGESSFSDFIEAQSVWYNFQLTFVRAKADYGKYLARMERLVGRSLTEPDSASIEPSGKE
jgi:cobalt-zinc-cadmium efflux system outer membrane protein